MSSCSSFFPYTPSVSSLPYEKGFILLHPTRPKWIAANQTALEIAECLDRGESSEEAAGQLAAHYGIPFEAAKNDVLYVAEELTRHHFLPGNSNDSPARSPTLNSIFFHITTRCNLSCIHCYVAGSVSRDLPASLILRIIDEMEEQGSEGVTFSGGEPLLHPEIRTILEYSAPRVKVQLLTNGTLIDKEWAAFLAQTISAIQMSVDGSTCDIHDGIRGKGSFERVMKAVEHLQTAGLAERITLSATVMAQNLEDLPRIIILAEKLGVPTVRFLPLRKSGRAKEQWHRIGSNLHVEDSEDFYRYVFDLQQSKQCSVDISCGLSGFLLKSFEDDAGEEIWCPVGKKLVIDVHGDIYPCVLMMEDEFRLGNSFQQDLAAIIRSERMAELCNALVERRTVIKQCSECQWRNLCQGGCMGQAVDHHGTIWDPDHFCGFRKKAYQNAFDRIIQRSFGRG